MSKEDLCYGLFFTAGTADMKVVKWWRRPTAEVIRMCMVRLIPDALFLFVILIQTYSKTQLWVMHKVRSKINLDGRLQHSCRQWFFRHSYPNWFHYSVVTDAWSVGKKAMHCGKTWAIRKHCIVGGLDQSKNSVLWEIWSNRKAMHYRKFGVIRKQCIFGQLKQPESNAFWEDWINRNTVYCGKFGAIRKQCIIGYFEQSVSNALWAS